MLSSQIKHAAADAGFDTCFITKPIVPTLHQEAYVSWCKTGGAAGMDYMLQNQEKRIHPAQIFPDATTVMTLGISYYQGAVPPKPGAAYGRVARYAWGLDYHTVIKTRLEKFARDLKNILGDDLSVQFALDTKPVLERALAVSSNMGFIGKNTMLIVPRTTDARTGSYFHVGSFLFLAEVFLNYDLEVDDTGKGEKPGGCGSCTSCLTACPTDAFEGPYRMKADRCISYLTIENKNSIPVELRKKMGDWIFGCDICQDVCPFNARAYETRWPEFQASKGTGAWVSLKQILSMKNNDEFKSLFGHTPLARPKRRGLIRNACVTAGNSGDKSLLPALESVCRENDDMLTEHAEWALAELR